MKGETSPSVPLASFCSPHVVCQDAVRTGFWQRLFASASIEGVVRALPEVPRVIAGDSKVWFPRLVDSRPPRNVDRGCLELIRLLLETINVEIQPHVVVPTHRHGGAPAVVFATPGIMHSVEVQNGTNCERRMCCPLLGSDHFALMTTLQKQANISVISPPPVVHVRDWRRWLLTQQFKIQSSSDRAQQLLKDTPSSPHVESRQHMDDLYAQSP